MGTSAGLSSAGPVSGSCDQPVALGIFIRCGSYRPVATVGGPVQCQEQIPGVWDSVWPNKTLGHQDHPNTEFSPSSEPITAEAHK